MIRYLQSYPKIALLQIYLYLCVAFRKTVFFGVLTLK